MVDETWREYKNGLSNAIEALIGVRVDARTWARVMVPFVACMLVRGPDFAGRFGRRLAALGIGDIDGGYTPADNANLARLMELQRLSYAEHGKARRVQKDRAGFPARLPVAETLVRNWPGGRGTVATHFRWLVHRWWIG